VSHPSLGRPPRDLSAGSPTAARQIRASIGRLAERALETAIDRDPTFKTRYDELGLRERLRDAELLAAGAVGRRRRPGAGEGVRRLDVARVSAQARPAR
jgi:hypothetical protein